MPELYEIHLSKRYQFFGSVAGSLPAGALPARDPAVRYVVNQIDTRRRLGRDMLSFLRGQLGDRLIGGAYRDEAVAEAIATGITVGAYAPQSRAAHDFHEIGLTLDRLLAPPPSPPPSPALRRAGSGRALP